MCPEVNEELGQFNQEWDSRNKNDREEGPTEKRSKGARTKK